MVFVRDVQFAVRNLLRTPGFTLVVVLTLALGIGASTAIFSVVHAVVLRPLGYHEPERLVRITSELRGFGATDTGVAAPELYDYQARTDLFTGVAGIMPVSANMTSGPTPERVEVLLVTWNYFGVLGVAPAYGRVFGPQDDTAGVANLAVVSEGFWRRSLAADPNAVGRTIEIDGDLVAIVGVMPAGFRHPGRTVQGEVDVWSPAGFRGGAPAPQLRSRRRLEGCLARLQPGVTLEQAQARLDEYGAAIGRQFPSEYPASNGWRPRVVELRDDVVGPVATPMFLLLSGVGLLLLVACVNVGHLVLARASGRQQEMAIRQALGASRSRLTCQLLTESAVLSAAAGAFAVIVASWGVRVLLALAPGRVPRISDARLDGTAIAVTALIAGAVTLLFGFVPALHARRFGMSGALKGGGPGRTADRRAGRARDVLVAAEVAMATVLLVGAGLFVRTVVGLLNVPVGFETEQLLTARMTLPRPNDAARATYLDPDRRTAVYRETLQRVAGLPGVARAALSSQIPLGGFNPPLFIEIEGGGGADARSRPVMHSFQVSPSYFETMGVRILHGRPFDDGDRATSEPVAIVSVAAARAFWKDGDPVGARLRLGEGLPWMTVIGVAADVLNRRLTETPQAILYRPIEQSSDLTMALLVRRAGDAPNLVQQIAREVRAVDPGLPIHSVRAMNELIGAAVGQRQFLMRLLVAFGSAATVLALLGIYGVMAYAVSQRTREIGIRMAVGASRAEVARMVVRRGLLVTTAGALAGLAASLALSRLIESQLFGVRPSDPLTLTLALGVMALVALAAAYGPARRAARVDPIVALRTQ